jgi:hypothetical protein
MALAKVNHRLVLATELNHSARCVAQLGAQKLITCRQKLGLEATDGYSHPAADLSAVYILKDHQQGFRQTFGAAV